MLLILFFIALIWIVWKLFVLGIKMAWGITKFFFTVLLFPLILVGMVLAGMIYIAVPILIIVGIVVLIGNRVSS